MTTQPAPINAHDQVAAIVEHAREHSFLINPATGYVDALRNIKTFHHCPCDASRPKCPCPQSVDEVKNIGYCKCRLYWRDLDTFAKKMIS